MAVLGSVQGAQRLGHAHSSARHGGRCACRLLREQLRQRVGSDVEGDAKHDRAAATALPEQAGTAVAAVDVVTVPGEQRGAATHGCQLLFGDTTGCCSREALGYYRCNG